MKVACVLILDFEVAVELRRRPDLAGRPVIVGGLPHERKAVLGCSPEAAAHGVAPGISLRQAHGLCPGGLFLPADETLYRESFSRLLSILDTFSPKVEVEYPQAQHSALSTQHSAPVYLDAAGLELLFGPDEELGGRMAAAVEAGLGLRPRVGLGSGKFVAQRAALLARPGLALVVRPGEERSFLAPLPVEQLPCSREMLRRLHLLGLKTLGQLVALPEGALAEQFGPEGVEVSRLARGIDERPVIAREVPAVLEEGMEIDLPDAESGPLLSLASRLIDRLVARLRADYLACRGVALHLDFRDGSTAGSATTLHEPTDRKEDLERVVERLVRRIPLSGASAQDTEDPAAAPLPRSDDFSRWSSPGERRDERLKSLLPEDALPGSPGSLQFLRISLSDFGAPGGEQLGLFRNRADALKRVRRTMELAEEQFGGGALRSLAEMEGEKPAPEPLTVVADTAGWPRSLFLRGRWERAREVCNRWRVEEDWWRQEISREYFRVITESGRLCVIFRDLAVGGWFLEKTYL